MTSEHFWINDNTIYSSRTSLASNKMRSNNSKRKANRHKRIDSKRSRTRPRSRCASWQRSWDREAAIITRWICSVTRYQEIRIVATTNWWDRRANRFLCTLVAAIRRLNWQLEGKSPSALAVMHLTTSAREQTAWTLSQHYINIKANRANPQRIARDYLQGCRRLAGRAFNRIKAKRMFTTPTFWTNRNKRINRNFFFPSISPINLR